MKNIIIIGAGISGLTAAIYTARANLQPLVVCGPEDGGQLTLTTEVENFPGFENGIQGPELVATSKKQAQRFGAEFLTGWITSIQKIKDGFEVTLQDKQIFQAKSIIISTGASARWLGLKSEQKFKGKGVSTCATCDGFFYKNKEIVVVGGGDSAMEEANFLTKFASKVTVIHRRDELRASKIMQDKFFKNPKTDIIWNSTIKECVGDTTLTSVKLQNTVTNEITDFSCDGVFLAIGHIPNTKMLKGFVDMDEQGYILTNRFTHTNIPGVFACGDVQDTKYRQAITAAGSGCQSALEAERYIEGLE